MTTSNPAENPPTTPDLPFSAQVQDAPDDAAKSQPAPPPPAPEPVIQEPSPALRDDEPAAPEEEDDAPEAISYQLQQEPIPKKLQRLRVEHNVTIREVSQKTLISTTFINDLEAGSYLSLPDEDQCLERIRKLCDQYGVTADEIEDIIKQFSQEYAEHLPQTTPDHTHKARNGGILQTNSPAYPSHLPSLPSLILLGFIIVLAITLLYAFFAYNTRKLPENSNIDFSQYIPKHKPNVQFLEQK